MSYLKYAPIVVLLCCHFAAAQVGDVYPVHDPSIISQNQTFYLFSTGRGLSARSSTDLYHWKRVGQVFHQPPEWTNKFTGGSFWFWAPDISFTHGEYRLYYAVSSFGRTLSAIGLAANKTLDPTSADFKWIDRGIVISTPANNNWNAIDPCAFNDDDGKSWLVLGSCWTGIKLIALDPATGLAMNNVGEPTALAAYPPSNILEEGYLRKQGDFYYLYESVGYCCRGAASTYRVLVGRSKGIRGPYLDIENKPLLRGGGTLLLSGLDNVHGPGSCAIAESTGQQFLVHHFYDVNKRGMATLQIRPLFYMDSGWPVVGQPITQPVNSGKNAIDSLCGDWLIYENFDHPQSIQFKADGTLTPFPGSWKLDGTQLTLNWKKPSITWVVHCIAGEGGAWFAGRDVDGTCVNAVRIKPK